jgi:hypothetical protein
MPLMVSTHHYAFDAVALLDDCIDRLQLTIEKDVCGKYDAIYDLKEVLVATEGLLHEYLMDVLEKEKSSLRAGSTTSTSSTGRINLQETRSLSATVESLKRVLEEKKRQQEVEMRRVHFRNPQESPVSQKHCYYPTRSAADTLLFRLIVDLQLCLVRIEVAYSVITGRRIGETHDKHGLQVPLVLTSCVAGVGAAMVTLSRKNHRECWRLPPRNFECLTATSAKVGAALIAAFWIRKSWKVWWMANKIVRSTAEIEEWHQQWRVIESTSSSSSEDESPELLDAKSRRLVEYAMREAPKVCKRLTLSPL